jgi:FkbM family methyltransferase
MNELIDFCLDTENPEKNYKLAQWYEKQNHTASAHVYYFRAAERTENKNFAYTSLLRSSVCYKSQGKRDATEKLLIHAALSFLTERPEAYYFLSLFYERKEEWDQCYLYADFGLKCYENEVESIDLPEYQGKYALIYQKALASWWWGRGEESKKLFQSLKNDYWNVMNDNYKNLVNEKLFTFFKQESAKYSKEVINVDNAILEKYTLENKDLKVSNNEEVVEPNTIRKKIGFDVGACVGETISKFDGFDKIYAFEPAPHVFNILVEKHKNDPRIEFYEMAISDEDGVKSLKYHYNYGYSSFLEIDKEGEFAKKCQEFDPGFDNIVSIIDVQTKRIDTFMQENCIEHIDFLKIDTQGNDLNVIKSLGKMIDKVDTIELEVQIKPLYKNSSSKEEIVDFMQKNNFNLISEESNNFLLKDYEERLTFKQKKDKSCFSINEYKKSTSWIVDNFYDNPDEIRKFALEQEFGDESVITGFVGRRTFNQFLFPKLKEAFESVMGKKITKWEEHGMNGRFQICWSGERLVYHCDSQRWGGMIYLTPNAPFQCGTTLYADKKNRARTYYDQGWDEYWANTPGDCHLDRTPFEPVDVFGNVYNRLVIFDASCIHSASEYFGTNKENARLWQMFFFDTED